MLVNFVIQDENQVTVASADRNMDNPPRIGEFVKFRGTSYFINAVAHVLQGEGDDQNDFMRIWLSESSYAPIENV